MKILKTGLVASTALCLSMSAAYAGNNNASYLDQQGDDNVASVDQSGGTNSQAGRVNQDMFQNGDDNILSILQAGDGSRMGVNSAGSGGEVIQTGSRNELDSTQSGLNNAVNTVHQTAEPGLANTSNTATVRQIRDNNLIGLIDQSSTVASSSVMNTMTLEQKGVGGNKIFDTIQKFTGPTGIDGNLLSIVQDGTFNRVDTAKQIGQDNDMDIQQDGQHNKVVSATQDGGSNTAKLHVDGFRNGLSAFASGSYAEMSGAAASSSVQNQIGNSIDFLATGDDNGFGFYQNGISNSVGKITLTGDDNELGVWQDGTGNVLGLGTVAGSRNDIGVRQDGSNDAQINLTNSSDDNAVWVNQLGANTAATINIDGDSNLAMLHQDGSNSADIDITGDRNNNTTATSWGGVAAGVLGAGSVGLMSQTGSGNSLNVTVNGSDNLWATDQDGPGNTIMAMVTGGSNQFAVQQTSTTSGNHATVTQNGSGNNAGVSQ